MAEPYTETTPPHSTPRALIDHSPMHPLQWLGVLLAILLNTMDGYDIQASSFAARPMAEEWGINQEVLGVVLSAQLWGMIAGSLLLGWLADRLGRRNMILTCLAIMTLGMGFSTTAHSAFVMLLWRLFTGLGIGGMLATLTATTAELTNHKWRGATVSAMTVGVPVGGMFGAWLAEALLTQHYPWRSIFYVGAALSLLFIPIVLALLPESIAWYEEKQPANALAKINTILKRFGKSTLATLPHSDTNQATNPYAALFSGIYRNRIIMLTLGYACMIMLFYFCVSQTPNVVSSLLGHSKPEGNAVLKWSNLGGIIGCLVFALAVKQYGIKRPTILAMLMSSVMILYFGSRTPADTLTHLEITAVAEQFFINAAVVGYYAGFASAFPTHMRATATGVGIGIGRIGAALAPMIAGVLFKNHVPLFSVTALYAAISIIGALILFAAPLPKGKPQLT
jgi:benzoate transport